MSENISKSEIDWNKVQRVLVVRLRSIGDTVLSTPSLIALKRFLPDAQIDILLEDWVAPVLEGFDAVDNILMVSRNDKKSRLETALKIRRNKYDVAFNLHGGTTATFFVRASGAKYRVGLAGYQYNFLYTHLAPSPLEFWKTEHTHSAEQQLALLGFVGVPVKDKPKSRLVVSGKNAEEMDLFLHVHGVDNEELALIHPAAAFEEKQWSIEKFAKIIDYLAARNIFSVAVAAPEEKHIIEELTRKTSTAFHGFSDLTLPEITALASRAKIFVGNDSGIAHIAAAVNTPTVVIFGSSNVNHWRPWTNAPNEIVYAEKPCNHRIGEIRKGSENPKCIRCVTVKEVGEAIERVLRGAILVAEKRGEQLN
ncbi:MAG: glycosyltransferase family 9 protein [Acidobacteriota bacterium]|nr:glycosyltransferase family 9 protein [Acidobacteriota bacterium]